MCFVILYQDEWRRGLKALRADTVTKLKKALPDLEREVSYVKCSTLWVRMSCIWYPHWQNKLGNGSLSWWIFILTILPLIWKVRRPSSFVDFYSYAFRYCLTGNWFCVHLFYVLQLGKSSFCAYCHCIVWSS